MAQRVLVTAGASGIFSSRCELYAHELVAKGGGLSHAKISTIAAGQRPSDLDPTESTCYGVAVVLASGKILPEVTYQLALQTFGGKQVAELVYLVANYCQLAVLLNAYDVPAPEWE